MGRKGKETKEQTSRLESLRDDCRRHPSAPIPLWRFEGEKFEIGGEGAERKRALSAIDRLGAILAQSSPSRPADLRVDRALAVEAVLKAIPFRADVAIESHLEGQASGETSALCRQRVPDVLASVAELCDAMLRGVKPRQEEGGKRRLRREEFVATALLALHRLRNSLKREPTSREIAEEMGVHPSAISRRLKNDAMWQKAIVTAEREPRAVDRSGMGVGLAEDDRNDNAIPKDFFDSQTSTPRRVRAKPPKG
jgi:hypothetical protein